MNRLTKKHLDLNSINVRDKLESWLHTRPLHPTTVPNLANSCHIHLSRGVEAITDYNGGEILKWFFPKKKCTHRYDW